MKKNIVIVSLIVMVICFAYLGIYQNKQNSELELELALTQKALYAFEVGLEGAQYKMRFSGDPTSNDRGLFVFDDYLEGGNEYKSRIQIFGYDYPIIVNWSEESARIADSYEGYELENAYIFNY